MNEKYKRILAALHALPKKKQVMVIEEMRGGVRSVTPDGLPVTVRGRRELRRLTTKDDAGFREWARGFEAGEVFYDVGANVGVLTLATAALHRDRVCIVAIEPSFGSFESLVRNLSLNGLLGFTIPLQVAVLDATGLQPMNYRSTLAGDALHAVGEALDQRGQPFSPVAIQLVPTFRLDDLVEVLGLPRPTRIKIDVDGYEERVLRGSARLLAAGGIRELSVEVDRTNEARLESVSALLTGFGYQMVRALHHKPAEGESESTVADYLFSRVTRRPAHATDAASAS